MKCKLYAPVPVYSGGKYLRVTAIMGGLLIALISAGCSSQPIDSNPVRDLSFETIDKGSSSGIETGERLVIESAADWEDLWGEHTALRTPAPALPGIDFSRQMVIAVFSGLKSTGGYSVEITEIRATNRELNIVYQVTEPGPDDMVTEAETQPFHIIKIGRVDGLSAVFTLEEQP
ncbi:MAG: protease complex subunit PrcB family protein [Dehalococcoidales bacterium]